MLFQKFILRRSTGRVVCDFAEKMGTVYIKMAQILAMQNIGEIFTEDDRQRLAEICDHCQPVPFQRIETVIQNELPEAILAQVQSIDPEPLGSASISQVHHACLNDGTEIVFKVKRRDITKGIEHDVRQLKRCIRRFGRFTVLQNFLGSDKALSLWAEWIYSETDFDRERRNLESYREFATNVNGKIRGSKNICVPQIYSEFCTENIIAMEYISAPTVNQIELNSKNKAVISRGLNDYISLSFWALLHGETVIFHGDPHGGNIYFDQSGNIGFLDMGLVFVLDGEESQYVRTLFLNAYLNKPEEIADMLIAKSEHNDYNRNDLIADIQVELVKFHQINVTNFFINMINVFVHYDIAPPEILFKMAKAFLALYGINTFIGNTTNVEDLLAKQVVEFYVHRTYDDLQSLSHSGLKTMSNILTSCLHEGLMSGCITSILSLDQLSEECTTFIKDGQELLSLIRARLKT